MTQKTEDKIFSENEISFWGNREILKNAGSAFVVYSSQEIPEKHYREYENFYKALMEQKIILAGGWHSPFEKDLFKQWKNEKSSSLIYCTARSLNQSFTYFSKLFEEIHPDKFLIIDPEISANRISKQTVKTRDDFMLNYFNNFIFTYIKPGGYCEKLMEKAEDSGKNIFLFNHVSNEMYINDYVTLIDPFTLDILKCV